MTASQPASRHQSTPTTSWHTASSVLLFSSQPTVSINGRSRTRCGSTKRGRCAWCSLMTTTSSQSQSAKKPSRQQISTSTWETIHGRTMGTSEQWLKLHTLLAQNAQTTGLQPPSPCQCLQEPHQQPGSSKRHNSLLSLPKRQKRHVTIQKRALKIIGVKESEMPTFFLVSAPWCIIRDFGSCYFKYNKLKPFQIPKIKIY